MYWFAETAVKWSIFHFLKVLMFFVLFFDRTMHNKMLSWIIMSACSVLPKQPPNLATAHICLGYRLQFRCTLSISKPASADCFHQWNMLFWSEITKWIVSEVNAFHSFQFHMKIMSFSASPLCRHSLHTQKKPWTEHGVSVGWVKICSLLLHSGAIH